MSTIAAYRQAVIDTGPVVYWPMNDGSGSQIVDVSGGGNHATLGSDGSWYRAIPYPTLPNLYAVNSAVGTSSVSRTITLPTSAANSEWWTLLVWAHVPDPSVNTLEAWRVDLAGSNFSIRQHGMGVSRVYNGTAQNLIITPSDPYSQWNSFVFTKSSLTANKFWVDFGTRSATDGTSMNVAGTTGITIYSGATPAYIGHVAFWNRVLSDAEIATVMARSTVDSLYPLAEVWKPELTKGLPVDLTIFRDSPWITEYLGAVANADLAGTLALDLSIPSAALTLTEAVIPVALAGSIDADVGLAGDLVVGVPLTGDMDVSVTLMGGVSPLVPLAGAMDVDVDMSATLLVSVPFAGSMDIDVGLAGVLMTDQMVWYASGTVDADITAAAVVIDYDLHPEGTATVDFTIWASGRKLMRLPPPPAPPPEPDPEDPNNWPMPAYGGITIRALYGKTVTMNDPVIVDGKPT